MMPEGRYWIGDLCLVIEEDWDWFCNYVILNNGEFRVEQRNNEKAASFHTGRGDGHYTDLDGRGYDVESGTIGCIHFDTLRPGDISGIDMSRLVEDDAGRVVTFEEPFEVWRDEDTVNFGHISINVGNP